MRTLSKICLVFSSLLASACQSAPSAAPPVNPRPAPQACTGARDARPFVLPATRAPDNVSSDKGRPFQYAVNLQVNQAVQALATVRETAEGWTRWLVPMSSAGAKSLSLHLSAESLPASAEVWLCAEGFNQGPLRPAPDGELYTPRVTGDRVLLEVLLPASEAARAKLTLVEVFGGFR